MESFLDQSWQTFQPLLLNLSTLVAQTLTSPNLSLPVLPIIETEHPPGKLFVWTLLTAAWPLLTLLCYALYRPKPLPEKATYNGTEDVTIVVATIDADDKLKQAIQSWLAGSPKEIIIVTIAKCFPPLETVARDIDPDNAFIRVIVVGKANKRLQLAAGIQAVTTRLFVTCDDDVFWPPGLLPRLLACFEDPELGGATVAGGVEPVHDQLTPWEVLGDLRMTTLGVIRCASSTMDGGITALSGRTSAYRTELFDDPEILDQFVNERWMGKYQVSSADGCALTESIVKRGWKTYMQNCDDTELHTTVKDDWTWLLQVIRWSRDHWRQNIKAIVYDPEITVKFPFTTGGRIHECLQPFSAIVKVMLVSLVTVDRYKRGLRHSILYEMIHTVALLVAAQIPQMMMLLPHLSKKPRHFLYFPAWGLYCYFRGIISFYALFTLHKTGWGTRKA